MHSDSESARSGITPGQALAQACEKSPYLTRRAGTELARRLGYTPKHISEVLHDKARITADMALRLEYVLRYPAAFWMAIQQEYDLQQARETRRESVAMKEERTDTQRLDALERLAANGDCPGIVNDDNGHWAVTGSGVLKVLPGDAPQDVETTLFVSAAHWRSSLREAIDAYLDHPEPEV